MYSIIIKNSSWAIPSAPSRECIIPLKATEVCVTLDSNVMENLPECQVIFCVWNVSYGQECIETF